MLHQEFDPPEALGGVVKCFWYNRADFGQGPSDFVIMPDGYTEIIFHFGGSCRIAHDSNPLPSPFIMGLLNQPLVLNAKDRMEILAIRCFPWTVFDLLGLPSGKEGVHILNHPVSGLQAPLAGCVQSGRIEEALELITQYCLQVRSAVNIDNMLLKAGGAMRAAKGSMPVSQVAAAAHATVRTLERKFKESSGYTVKDVSGLIRFEQARNQLWHYPDTNLAGLAMELGYTDQAHLSREFKRYSGTSPAAFARKAKKGERR
ncbi:AraC family transcriptional regulator [Chitinophaga qingshengii]|uniref:AraC family transcriptional regulator n=1 Tax=Chitinophaga qingshengii TaxID=1569794 RepID=A0ABR7TVW3_9BACT|nr:helix-turn-helix domain-containing protein [Chitinophaga qingshengii]MBC9933129.1 AraC family transcriptional regulator [Chitinophaga qingshengii]